MRVFFLVEEQSMANFLEQILPKLIPADVYWKVLPHDGKSDLQKSLPLKLSGIQGDDVRFMVIQDQDSNDCIRLKNHLLEIAKPYKRTLLVRIACRELESWYFGDLEAVAQAYGKPALVKVKAKAKYRIPDSIENPKNELKKLLPELQQISGGTNIGKAAVIERNTSKSFQVFCKGVQTLLDS